MAYRHNDTLHNHQKRAIRFKRFAFVFSAIVFIAVAVIGIDWMLNQINSSETIVSTVNSKSVQSANVSVYRTEYFQFQAPDSWVEVANENSENSFVYVNNNGSLITQKLTVYVNQPERSRDADYKITRVLPTTIDKEGNFNPQGKVSSHCNDSWPKDLQRNPSRITHDSVSFVCAPSSQQYNVVVGSPDGSETYKVTLNDGREVTLMIVYSDLTAYPSPGEIYSIVSSFSTL